ncbi:DNA modification methylase [Caldicoprobacter guelmensis]|uniref:site-specific DNA-methyltransferase n=1 Tax=Caldicoprobacter guelmensis TaxID=1170224 RepID=UPI00195D42B4|nr:site-specific DNA-methyltransferase [Caldicoprobacter guelmensis]MBM7583079.1 DNA modification methylase [Caldicoprobacter guelmensis]
MSDVRMKKVSTKTSAFGTPGRFNHDSSEFYSSRLYQNIKISKNIKFIENPIPKERLNKIYCKSSESMDEIPDYSVHLMVTSPPYNVKKEYDEDLTLDEYRELLRRVFKETYKKYVGLAEKRIKSYSQQMHLFDDYIVD